MGKGLRAKGRRQRSDRARGLCRQGRHSRPERLPVGHVPACASPVMAPDPRGRRRFDNVCVQPRRARARAIDPELACAQATFRALKHWFHEGDSRCFRRCCPARSAPHPFRSSRLCQRRATCLACRLRAQPPSAIRRRVPCRSPSPIRAFRGRERRSPAIRRRSRMFHPCLAPALPPSCARPIGEAQCIDLERGPRAHRLHAARRSKQRTIP